ncbi:MAG: HupE/UreJ family protein [Schleiferiaceae bacterium]|jgi:hypothetical protein|nr:HupE/UreJ family protein [Schleiferiaceae bacterium]MDR9443076.1 HupE/UreJ family protein [Schleiferiaceae bacterium]
MSNFSTYLQLGYEHIVSFDALDHILFIVALMAVYQLKHWLRMIIAISFFALGHSVSLALAAAGVVDFEVGLIEFLIPATIVFTALINLTKGGRDAQSRSKYWLAGIFGVIHGLGFSNYYGMLTMGESTYWQALLPFNLGVELGQLVVVLVFLVALLVYEFFLNKKLRDWSLFWSGVAFGLALVMCIENWPFDF